MAVTTVLNTTQTTTGNYASGNLDVSALQTIAVDFTVSTLDNPSSGFIEVQVARIGADGNPYLLLDTTIANTGSYSYDIGPGLPTNKFLGGTIQVSLNNPFTLNLSTTISVIGK